MGAFVTLLNFDYAFIATPHEQGKSLALGCIGEFACVARVFAPFVTTLASSKMVNTMLVLQSHDINPPCLDFLLDFHPNLELKLFVDSL